MRVNASVLLVADDSQVRERVRAALAAAIAEGWLLVEASAAAAHENVRRDPYSCVVVDARLVAVRGRGWLGGLVACGRATPVVLLAPVYAADDAARALEDGVQDCLGWADAASLVRVIDHAVARQLRLERARAERLDRVRSGRCARSGALDGSLLGPLRVDDLLGTPPGDPSTCALLIECNGLRDVRELHGDAAADRVLREAANRARPLMRAADVLACVSGEALVWLMPTTAPADADALAQRLRAAVARRPVAAEPHTLRANVRISAFAVPPHVRFAQVAGLGAAAMSAVAAAGAATDAPARGRRWPLHMLRSAAVRAAHFLP